MPFVKAHLKYSDIELMKLFKDYDMLINKKILFIQTYDKHKYIFYTIHSAFGRKSGENLKENFY